MLLIAVGAFVTATAFRFVLHTPSPSKTALVKNSIPQKKLAIRCAPAYVPTADEDIPPLTGWGNFRWKISTKSDSAQFYFNQGMAMYYAFHIIESRASFDKAARFDPSCALIWWGKALAFGPNINDFGYQRPSEAFSSASKASRLKASCTPVEKALIDAIAIRYVADSTVDQKGLNENYKNAMASVYKRFGSNAEVAALYADAQMILHPWDFYTHSYSPKPWTPHLISTLKRALKLSPQHVGANHYYIHAVEASARPGDALKSARVLSTAMPGVAHITHMPSHIYIRTGYYNKGIDLNTQAVDGYKKYQTAFAPAAEGAFLYSLHNLHMKMACAQMAGNYAEALSSARQLKEEIPADYLTLPGALGHYIQYVHQAPLFTYLRFGKWEEIIAAKQHENLEYGAALEQFGRGVAFAKLGRLPEATEALAQLQLKLQNAALQERYTPFNTAYDGGRIAQHLLEGVIAEQQNKTALAVQHFQEAVKAEDRLVYDEPRDWILPTRHYLGNALLNAGRYNEALAVLQDDLVVNPANGWALTGMQNAFENLSRSGDVLAAKQRLKNAWLIKDVEISKPVF